MQPLHGVGVLVTRPAHQAFALCRLLEDAGALTACLPALQIVALQEQPTATFSADPFDLIVFTSANAVRFGARLLADRRGAKLAAVGPATARALQEAGHPDVILPDDGFDSEGLLKDRRLTAHRHVLLVKGRGGRDALRLELARRGAKVQVADVYERRPATPGAAELHAITSWLSSGAAHVVTATSAEIAAALLALATPDLKRALDRLHWLVPSERVERAGRELGIAGPMIRANSAEDHDLLAALVRWRSSESGA